MTSRSDDQFAHFHQSSMSLHRQIRQNSKKLLLLWFVKYNRTRYWKMLKTCQNHFRHAQTLAYTNVWIVPSPIHSEHPHSTSFYCLVPNMCASPYWNPGFSTWTKGKNISRVILRTSCGLSRTAGRMGYHQPTWCTPNSGGLWSFHIISTYDYINYNYFWVACLDSCIYIYICCIYKYIPVHLPSFSPNSFCCYGFIHVHPQLDCWGCWLSSYCFISISSIPPSSPSFAVAPRTIKALRTRIVHGY